MREFRKTTQTNEEKILRQSERDGKNDQQQQCYKFCIGLKFTLEHMIKKQRVL